jgi:hypothetical protein
VAWPCEGGGGGEVRPGARKTMAIRVIRAVEVEVNGQGDARERGGLAGAVSVAGGGLTTAVASGGAAVAVEVEKKKNTSGTVISLYRATKPVSRRRVARREHTEAHAGGRGRAWKLAEGCGGRPAPVPRGALL